MAGPFSNRDPMKTLNWKLKLSCSVVSVVRRQQQPKVTISWVFEQTFPTIEHGEGQRERGREEDGERGEEEKRVERLLRWKTKQVQTPHAEWVIKIHTPSSLPKIRTELWHGVLWHGLAWYGLLWHSCLWLSKTNRYALEIKCSRRLLVQFFIIFVLLRFYFRYFRPECIFGFPL